MSPGSRSGWQRARRQTRTGLVYPEDYGIDPAKLITSGVGLWLNTPQPPLEASGTSKKLPINMRGRLCGIYRQGCKSNVKLQIRQRQQQQQDHPEHH